MKPVFVFEWVDRRWTMSFHGVSGEAEVTFIVIQYSLIDQGRVLSMDQYREYGIQLMCRYVL